MKMAKLNIKLNLATRTIDLAERRIGENSCIQLDNKK